MPNLLIKFLTAVTKRMVHPRDVSEGAFGEQHYQCATLDLPAATVFQVVIDLPSGIGGTIQVGPAGDKQPLWDNSASLESIDFNERVEVFASSKALAFRVLAPDFMAWLMDQPQMPSMFIIEKRCFVAFRDNEGGTNDARLRTAEKVLSYVMHSGALEK